MFKGLKKELSDIVDKIKVNDHVVIEYRYPTDESEISIGGNILIREGGSVGLRTNGYVQAKNRNSLVLTQKPDSWNPFRKLKNYLTRDVIPYNAFDSVEIVK